ncbi:MAG: hypothetical protein AAGI30_05370 [Planctomycetota bacterium]
MKKRKHRRKKQRAAQPPSSPVTLPTPPATLLPERRGVWFWTRRSLLILIGVLTAVGVVAWWQAGRAPAWWGEVARQVAHPTAPDRARLLESGLVSLGGPGSRDPVAIEERDANAWLAHRLPDWLANQGVRPPPELTGVGLRFEPGLIRVAVQMDRPAADDAVDHTFIAAAFRPEVDAGALSLRLASISSGRLALSADVFEQTIRRLVDRARPPAGAAGDAHAVIDALLGGDPITNTDELTVERFDVERGRLVLAVTR